MQATVIKIQAINLTIKLNQLDQMYHQTTELK